MKPLRLTSLLFSAVISVSAFANELPSLGDASSSIVSGQQEYQLGQAWLGLLRHQVNIIDDAQIKDYVESSVHRLAETSELRDHRLTFIVIRDPQINAFAAPGGIIGVNGGLFLYAQSEAEYVSVMAHELAHLSQRHFARGIEAQKRMQLPLMAAMLAGIIAAAAGGGDAGFAAIASTQAAAIQNQLRFSRQNEQEADRIGILNLERAGYDPRAMPALFERLARQYRFEGKPPEFLMTHPVTESRIADTRNRAEQSGAQGKTDSLRYQLMRARMQTLFEETPGMATKRFRAMLENNPELDAARYGLALSLMQQGRLNEARDQLNQLLKKTPNELTYHIGLVQADVTNNRLQEADSRLQKLLTQYPNNYPLKQIRAEVLQKMNRPGEAEKILLELSRTRSQDPDVWNRLAEVCSQTSDAICVHRSRAEYLALTGSYKEAIEQLDYAKRRAGNSFQLSARLDARQQELRQQEKLRDEMLR